jgi:hypothetical protein
VLISERGRINRVTTRMNTEEELSTGLSIVGAVAGYQTVGKAVMIGPKAANLKPIRGT